MLTISYPADASASHGRIEVVETLFHNQLYQYYNDPYIGDAEQAPVSETRDGPIPYQDGTSHPLVQVEARGHGVRLLYYEDPTSQVVLYSPSMRTAGEVPVNNGGAVIAAEYALEALAESLLWDGRRDAGLYMDGFANWNGRVYESRESHQLLEAFRGGGNVLRANPPWAWDDGNDPDVERGDWYLAPAYTVASHLAVPGLLGNIVADAEYYITHPFLEYQGNPPFGRQREESVGVARRGQTSEAVEGEEIRISYEGRALREWTGAGDERIAVREERLGDYIEIPVELVGSGAVVEADVGVPVGRRNAIRLRYRNPYGVPAVRATFVIVGGEEERRVSSTVILAGAGVEGETFDVEVREAMVYNAEEDDIEDLYIDGVELEFTSDLGRWGAEELSAHLPAALWEHVARFRGEQERYGAGASIDVREISIVAGGVGVGP